MKNKQGKIDNKFLIILTVLFLAVTVGGIYLEKISSTISPDISPVPSEADTSVYKDLIISEVLTNNGGAYLSEDGQDCDFVELYNGSSEEINLYSYGLSDRSDRIKWAFPDITIGPGQYLVVNLTGRSQEGLNAGFRLSSTGNEDLVLVDPKGDVIDAVRTVPLSKNQSMIRNIREWVIVDYPTPGFENSEKGVEEYRQHMAGEETNYLKVNEILFKNAGNYKNEYGRNDGYIELINTSDDILSLSGYYLSDDVFAPFKFALPKEYLSPGEMLLLYTGDNSYYPSRYTGFGFQNKSGSVFISKAGKIVETLEYENVPNGCAYIRNSDGSYYFSNALSPGKPNTAKGVDEFQKENMPVPKGLVINEVMSSNNSYLPQNGYKFYDWIELFNNTGDTILLSDYCLSTELGTTDLYRLPDVELQAGAFYIIMCSGNPDLTNDSYYHANFKVSGTETIYLFKNSKLEDCVFVTNIPLGYSYARGTSYGWTYASRPTPGSGNSEGYRMMTPDPTIELEGGIYNNTGGLSVAITGPGTIYYTTDGSAPTTGSRVYTGPIWVGRSMVIKAASIMDGARLSNAVCSSYIVNDPHKVPVVSLSLDPYQYSYLYANYTLDTKLNAYFELFEEDGSVSSPCGFGFSGLTGRRYNKKNMALKFDGEYGAKNLEYKVFDDLNCSSFDSIVLRGGSNADSSLPWKDEFASELAKDCLLTRKSKTIALYINGAYKGFYNIREKITPNMIAENYNVDKTLVNISRWNGGVEAGEAVWQDVMNWAKSHDLSSDANYLEFCRMVNVTELCDLWIFQMYMNNPDIYNIRVFSHPDIDGGRCKFIFFDLDLGFYGPATNYLTATVFNPSGYAQDLAGHYYDISVNNNLLRNSQFRQLFLERLSYHLHHTLSNENAVATFDYFTSLYAPEIERDMAVNGYSTSWYYSNIYEFRYLISYRVSTMMSYAQSFFGLSSSEMRSVFGDLY